VAAVGLAATSLAFATPALASQQAVEPGILAFQSICTSGTYHGVAQGSLANGSLLMSNCRSNGKLTTVYVEYRKSSGSTITARFAWQFTNSSGSNVLNGDIGPSFTQPAGNARHQIFYYSALAFPSQHPCVRGVLIVGGQSFHTKTEC